MNELVSESKDCLLCQHLKNILISKLSIKIDHFLLYNNMFDIIHVSYVTS